MVHATHTREIDELGGLARLMPSPLCFLAGAVAICGLLRSTGSSASSSSTWGCSAPSRARGPALAGVFAVPALALIGALAAACFVKVFGRCSSNSRLEHGHCARESGPSMVLPMGVLVALPVHRAVSGVVAPALAMEWGLGDRDHGRRWGLGGPPPRLGDRAGLALLGGLGLIVVLLRRLVRRGPVEVGATWGCGYPAPSVRMQYTSSSFAQMLVRLFAWVLMPRIRKPKARRLALFPEKSGFHSEVPDAVLDRGVLPAFRVGAWLLSRLRVLQRGNVQAYLLYIFLALLALLVWR